MSHLQREEVVEITTDLASRLVVSRQLPAVEFGGQERPLDLWLAESEAGARADYKGFSRICEDCALCDMHPQLTGDMI